MLAAFRRLNDRLGAQTVDEAVTHIGERRLAVGAKLRFHFRDAVLDHILFIL